jgi:hypothetical protein
MLTSYQPEYQQTWFQQKSIQHLEHEFQHSKKQKINSDKFQSNNLITIQTQK